MKTKRSIPALILGAAALAGSLSAAEAATLPLSYDTTYNGSSIVTTPAYPGGVVTTVPNTPTSYSYADTFGAATPAIPGTSYGFYDDFVFTVSGSVADSITTSINLGGSLQVSGLQERLFNLSGNNIPTLGVPVGGAIDAWTYPAGSSGEVAVLPETTLSAGTYVLEIRGTASGSGDSYSGVLDVAPVPLPAALPMLLGGLGMLGAAARRRRATQACR